MDYSPTVSAVHLYGQRRIDTDVLCVFVLRDNLLTLDPLHIQSEAMPGRHVEIADAEAGYVVEEV